MLFASQPLIINCIVNITLSHLVTLNNNTNCVNVNEITQHMKQAICAFPLGSQPRKKLPFRPLFIIMYSEDLLNITHAIGISSTPSKSDSKHYVMTQ